MTDAPDLFTYSPAPPRQVVEEPSAALFPDATEPGVQECSGDCVWQEFGLAGETGCEMCRVRDLSPGAYTPFSETVRAVFGERKNLTDR